MQNSRHRGKESTYRCRLSCCGQNTGSRGRLGEGFGGDAGHRRYRPAANMHRDLYECVRRGPTCRAAFLELVSFAYRIDRESAVEAETELDAAELKKWKDDSKLESATLQLRVRGIAHVCRDDVNADLHCFGQEEEFIFLGNSRHPTVVSPLKILSGKHTHIDRQLIWPPSVRPHEELDATARSPLRDDASQRLVGRTLTWEHC